MTSTTINVDVVGASGIADAMSNRSRHMASLIEACQDVSNRSDFSARVQPALQRIVPHAMLACTMVRIDDMRILDTMNLGFPVAWVEEAVDQERQATCPAIRKWMRVKEPVFLDVPAIECEPEGMVRARMFLHYGIRNVAVHGVMNLSQEHALCFSFGGIEGWSRCESFLLRSVIPHLHYALTNADDFGNKKSRTLLTPREQEVLAWVCCGKSNAEIACILGISPWTVKIHVGNLLLKLNASTRSHAVAKAIARGLVEV